MTANRRNSHGRSATNRRAFRRSIRFVLLAAVNVPLAVFAAVFLLYEYQRDSSERINDKRIALEEEARTLLPAVVQLRHHGVAAAQTYIDTVCGTMRAEKSPGHHIAVRLPTAVLQARSHGRASPEMMAALERAADSATRRATFEGQELIVGAASADGITTYVAESLANLKQTVRQASLRRVVGFIVVLFIAAGLVNFVLIRAVTNPIQRLATTVQQIGSGQLGVRPEPFKNAEMSYLSTEIGEMSRSLAAADRDREVQMAKAREIQQHLLPKDVRTSRLRVAHLFKPAEDIGGDYYDIIPLNNDSWLFCVADVTGHGIPAAMSAATLKTSLLQAAETYSSPAALLNVVNRRFASVVLPGDFASMILVWVEPQAGRLRYASAGHEPGWLVSAQNGPRPLSSTGPLLGIDETAAWEGVTIEANERDRLFIYTDGVSETFNARGEMFGRIRLAQLLTEFRMFGVEEAIRQIDETLEEIHDQARQHDDMTAVLLELTPDRE